jgi:hypothetical protein
MGHKRSQELTRLKKLFEPADPLLTHRNGTSTPSGVLPKLPISMPTEPLHSPP